MAKQILKTGKLFVCGHCYVVWSRQTGQGKMKNKEPDYLTGFPRYGKTELTCPKCAGVDVTQDKWWIDYGG